MHLLDLKMRDVWIHLFAFFVYQFCDLITQKLSTFVVSYLFFAIA